MKFLSHLVETAIFSSRFLIIPFLLGLIVGLAALIYKFSIKLFAFILQITSGETTEAIVGLLGLVDLTLTANLLVIVICSSYENFVAQTNFEEHPNWPPGLVRIGFSGLKQKLLGSIVAIAAVNALEWFADIEHHADSTKLTWVVGILLAFAVAMLILALADRLSAGQKDIH